MTNQTDAMQFELEKSILAIGFFYPDIIFEIVDRIEPADFRFTNTRLIWESMLRLCQHGLKIDSVSLSQDLHENGKFEIVGGESFIDSMMNYIPPFENIDHLIGKLRKASKKYDLSKLLTNGIQILTKSGKDVDDILNDIGTKFMDLSIDRKSQSGEIKDLLIPHQERFMNLNDLYTQGKNPFPGIETGFTQLDTKIDGFRFGTLNVLGARPGIGKTAVGINIALNVAKQGHLVIYFTLEMTSDEILSRMLANLSGFNSRWITGGNLFKEKVPQLLATYPELGALPILIYDKINTIEGIRNACRKCEFMYKKIGLIIFDYMQLIRVKDKFTEYDRVTEVSMSLKEISKHHNCPILAIAQLNRAGAPPSSEKGKSKPSKPCMENLRSSGQIEQDADTIIFLSKKDGDKPNLSILQFEVVKNRHGSIGKFEMDFKQDTCTLTKPTILDSEEDNSDM